jgi:hypothetical protein
MSSRRQMRVQRGMSFLCVDPDHIAVQTHGKNAHAYGGIFETLPRGQTEMLLVDGGGDDDLAFVVSDDAA